MHFLLHLDSYLVEQDCRSHDQGLSCLDTCKISGQSPKTRKEHICTYITQETDTHKYPKSSLLKQIQLYLNCPLVPLSYHVQRMYTSHEQAHADRSIPRFSPAAARLILLPKKARHNDLGRPTLLICAPYWHCCLLVVSTVCNCFSDAVY